MTQNTQFGLNETYVEILRTQWQEDPMSVPNEWQQFFSGTTKQAEPVVAVAPVEAPKPAPAAKVTGDMQPIFGIAKKIVENMELSLQIPTATSSRDIPVKVLEENRAIINDHLEYDAYARCSFTHLIAYAIVCALKKNMAMNTGFKVAAGQPQKLVRKDINLGLAIDLPSSDGGRTLLVPNLKACQDLDFWSFFKAYNDVLERARTQKLTPQDFEGTTVTLTNPGGLGTVASNPRLMTTQGAIFATGRIGYPAEYEAASPETIRALGIGKIMTVTSTYDHRVIQGAESGRFLAQLHRLLVGEDGFYEEIFRSLEIPYQPYRLHADQAVVLGVAAEQVHTERAMRVSQLIHSYRVRGYLLANVDPLHLIHRQHPELELRNYGLTIWDLDREFDTLGVLSKKTAPFREILARLRNSYCRCIGVDYMYIDDVLARKWLQERIERDAPSFSLDEKKAILNKLIQAEGFEHFLHKRFLGHKRFSIEGAEVAIAMLNSLLDGAGRDMVTDVLIGMAHRGRLNVLANIVGKPYAAIFAEFDDIDPKTIQGSGDVKYHQGARGVHHFRGASSDAGRVEERDVRVELACNPSHLEAVNPVVEGQVRAQQDLAGDETRKKWLPVLIHGDAAFAAQGIVYETLQLSGLDGYQTGGTIHIIINNQIGYTTPPEKGRTSTNCSDLARAILAPVFRVNGDDPEACLHAMNMAFEYRMKFGQDVVIDLVCYRRHGHNEGDEPSFTQPILYDAIQKHPSVATYYGELLNRRGDMTVEEVEKLRERHHEIFEKALSLVREKGRDAFSEAHVIVGQKGERDGDEEPRTAVDRQTLEFITNRVCSEPKSISVHPRVKSMVLDRRHAMVFEPQHKIDFGMAEILAYGSLILEGIPVRISGQDCGRGTFAHRHAVLYDIKDGTPYVPLNNLQNDQDKQQGLAPGKFRIYDSPLSEAAVLGFEYGYSVSHPKALVIWEAQFGDFFNGAQVQVDQMIASSEEKWGQRSRVALFLPHGYDGQGPEHSSARMERFLQMCAQDNMRIACCSSPAQFFHLLRRQAKQPKKPLIVFTHKSILRSEEAGSDISELSSGAFKTVILDKKSSKKTKRIVFCSGKIYWDLERARQQDAKLQDLVRIHRVEQLYPFPMDVIAQVVAENADKEICWVQEEPMNSGAFRFVDRYFRQLGVNLAYLGRAEAASPATGSPKVHKRQQEAIVKAAFDANAFKQNPYLSV